MVRPIPRRLLTDSIIYQEYAGTESFGDTFLEPETIDNVRFEPSAVIRIDGNGEQIQTQGRIFLDALNTPQFKPLKIKSKVTFNGNEMRVHASNSYSSFNKIHHLEIEVV